MCVCVCEEKKLGRLGFLKIHKEKRKIKTVEEFCSKEHIMYTFHYSGVEYRAEADTP